MSKTKTKQSATRKSPQSLESKAILRRRLSEGGMILLVTLALFFLLALLTYNPNDPGSFTNGSGVLSKMLLEKVVPGSLTSFFIYLAI